MQTRCTRGKRAVELGSVNCLVLHTQLRASTCLTSCASPALCFSASHVPSGATVAACSSEPCSPTASAPEAGAGGAEPVAAGVSSSVPSLSSRPTFFSSLWKGFGSSSPVSALRRASPLATSRPCATRAGSCLSLPLSSSLRPDIFSSSVYGQRMLVLKLWRWV